MLKPLPPDPAHHQDSALALEYVIAVSSGFPPEEGTHTAIVEFVDGQFWPRPHSWVNEEGRIAVTYREFEIIGNIYENPELLDETDAPNKR